MTQNPRRMWLSRQCQDRRPARTRAVGLIELVLLLAVIGMAVSSQRQPTPDDAQWIRDRAVIQELTNTIRAMRWRAPAARCTIELRIDAQQGRFQLFLLDRAAHIEMLQETIWLPKELEVIEAPAVIRASPTGEGSSASIIIEAPSYNRLFRVITQPTGTVRVDEEPTL